MRKPTAWSGPWTLPVVALLLLVLTAASRAPFSSRMLYAWDSANFAFALERYNVVFHQPHPPGYPLYVGFAGLLDLLVRNANTSLVLISIAASALAVAALFLLAARMYDPWVGLVSAALLGASVGFWGYGEVAYPYPALALFGVAVAWLCYILWQGYRWPAVLCGLLLGIAGGMRQDALLFLGPLWLVSVWRAGLPRLLLSALVLGLTVASWLYAAAQLSGGWAAFQAAADRQSGYVLYYYSALYGGGEALRRNVETFLLFLKQTFGLSLAVLVYSLGRFFTLRALVADYRLPFLLLWLLPPVLVYLLIHIGDPGYMLSLLPPLCIATAVGIRDIALDARAALLLLAARYRPLAGLSRHSRAAGTALAALLVLGLVVWNAIAFLGTPGPARLTEIRQVDAAVDYQVQYARGYRPDEVLVLAKSRFRQLEYYLRGYDVRLLFDEYQQGYREARKSYQIPGGVNTVLVTDFGAKPAGYPNSTGGEIVLLSDPRWWVTLWRFDVRAGDTIEYGYDYFAVKGRS